LRAQVASYAPELWEIFGITPITVWDLMTDEFFGMCMAIDQVRANREKEEK
jgi:hypothetical protein